MRLFRILGPFFEAEGASGGAAVAPVTPVVEAPVQEPAKPLSIGEIWERDNKAPAETPVQQPVIPDPAPAQPVESPVQAPQIDTPPPEKILGKYSNQGELIKAFQSLQGTYTKEHQAFLESQKVHEQSKTTIADLESKLQTLSQPPAQQPPTETTDEFDGLDSEAFAQKFYEDPKGFTKRIEDRAFAKAEKAFSEKLSQIESKINPVVVSVETQQHLTLWEEAASKFSASNPDAGNYIDDMRQYINDNNLSGSKNPEKVFSDALVYAKGQNSIHIQQEATASIAEKDSRISELEAQLKTNEEDIIKRYLSGIRTNQQQVPPSISGNSSSNAPATPLPKPTSIKEATRQAADRIFGGMK